MFEPDKAKKTRPNSVLFVCGMNAIRSPMAEAITKKHFGQDIFVQSAGVNEGNTDGFMLQVMDEIGINMRTHKPTILEDLEDEFFDVIITLSPEAHHRSLEWASESATDVEYWPTLDPSTVAGSRQQVVDAYSATRDNLNKRILNRFERN